MVLQTSLHDFQFDMLTEKQPLVIHDRVADMSQVMDAWFPYNRKKAFTLPVDTEAWHRNTYKYLVVAAHVAPIEVYLYGARQPLGADGKPDPQESLLAIALQPLQIVVVPRGMRYMISGADANAIGVHDWISFILP
jgi:homogentisate 1,2-dioxygenase